MPFTDWQFWVVTLVMLASLWMLKIVLLPKKKKGTKTTLTVGGKPIGKKSKSKDCNCG